MPPTPFAFTKAEASDCVLTDQRFTELLNAPNVTVHKLRTDYNDYGEFLFVTVHAPDPYGRLEPGYLTLFGLGYHERREIPITKRWEFYHTSDSRIHPIPPAMPRKKWATLLQERRNEIRGNYGDEPTHAPRSGRAALYNFVADLTDDDSAQTEMEDLEALGFDFEDF